MTEAPQQLLPGDLSDEQSELCAALTGALGALTHELRTPLGTLYNELALLRQHSDDPESTTAAERAAAALHEIINRWSAPALEVKPMLLSAVLRHFTESKFQVSSLESNVQIYGTGDRFASYLSLIAVSFTNSRTVSIRLNEKRADLIIADNNVNAPKHMLYPFQELAAEDSAAPCDLIHALTAVQLSGAALFHTTPDGSGLVLSLAIHGAPADHSR
jgi:hypothetical protein